MFACKNMAELTDFVWEKIFPLTTDLSGDHAEFEHMTVADAKGQEHLLNAEVRKAEVAGWKSAICWLKKSARLKVTNWFSNYQLLRKLMALVAS
ncbi:hypothetical protein [Lactobacillus delbrueckii]|uniref:hypothetical protein n=1 Tax=Lactobacillus delbrueckii TaxID=1584 RepID=UPI0021A5596E|nr:hypothetical protein [Lactobacillus delbrueckii]MCT2878055.1 hypothetical protein [Lactobacillus delbrueckii]MCT3491557.1 hypothetical protein [Lactobacillus delbrueckii]